MKTITVLVTPEVYSRIELAAIRDDMPVPEWSKLNLEISAVQRLQATDDGPKVIDDPWATGRGEG